jgi:glycosyltransferase involved in cell wall biosynthesis
MHLTLITSTYNSENTVEKYIDVFSNILRNKLGADNYEIIIVDDGSTDKTSQILQYKKLNDKKLKIVELNQNYGQHTAIKIALENVKKDGNDLVFYCDSDLEEDPEILINFVAKIKSGYDLVYGYQKKRGGSKIYNFFSTLFYQLFNFFSNSSMPKNVLSSHLFSDDVRKKILEFEEKNFFFHGIIHSIRSKKIGFELVKSNKGTSEYNLVKYTKMFFQVLFYNSTFPLYLIFWIGLIFVVTSFLIITSILLSALIFNYNYNAGWPSVVILIIFFGGLIQMSIGAIGLYVGYILQEIKKRPVLIKKKIE